MQSAIADTIVVGADRYDKEEDGKTICELAIVGQIPKDSHLPP